MQRMKHSVKNFVPIHFGLMNVSLNLNNEINKLRSTNIS